MRILKIAEIAYGHLDVEEHPDPEDNNFIEYVCAWCGKKMGTVKSKEPSVSHGICESCTDKALAELKAV